MQTLEEKPNNQKLTSLKDAAKAAGFSGDEYKKLQSEARYEYWLKKIKRIRKEQKLTQEDISMKTGIPRPAISRIENGYRNVTLDTLIQISRALNLELIIDFQEA
jgi:DNA-binding XRE family transcriptional regulator